MDATVVCKTPSDLGSVHLRRAHVGRPRRGTTSAARSPGRSARRSELARDRQLESTTSRDPPRAATSRRAGRRRVTRARPGTTGPDTNSKSGSRRVGSPPASGRMFSDDWLLPGFPRNCPNVYAIRDASGENRGCRPPATIRRAGPPRVDTRKCPHRHARNETRSRGRLVKSRAACHPPDHLSSAAVRRHPSVESRGPDLHDPTIGGISEQTAVS